MTAQIGDVFRYRGADHALAGVSDGTLFVPAELGLEPVIWNTACYRGYVATVAIADGWLVLADLGVNLYDRVPGDHVRNWRPAAGHTISGIQPALAGDRGNDLNNRYVGLNYPLDYTGGLLIADGFIRELYVHMGFHPAWKYRTVFEMTFDGGRLTGEADRPADVAAVRERAAADSPGNDVAGWIARCFDRSYGPE